MKKVILLFILANLSQVAFAGPNENLDCKLELESSRSTLKGTSYGGNIALATNTISNFKYESPGNDSNSIKFSFPLSSSGTIVARITNEIVFTGTVVLNIDLNIDGAQASSEKDRRISMRLSQKRNAILTKEEFETASSSMSIGGLGGISDFSFDLKGNRGTLNLVEVNCEVK